MYHVGPTAAHVSPVYRHTSFLRGLDSLDDEDNELSRHAASVAAKPRTLLSAPSLYRSGQFSPSPLVPPLRTQLTPTPQDDGEASSTTTATTATSASTTPMVAASKIEDTLSSIHDKEQDDTVNNRTKPNDFVAKAPLRRSVPLSPPMPPHSMDELRDETVVSLGAIGNRRNVEVAAARVGHDKHVAKHYRDEEDPEGSSGSSVPGPRFAPKVTRHSEGDRLPGIAHLDRHMASPWSSSVSVGGSSGVGGLGAHSSTTLQQYRRATEYDDRTVPPRWAAPFSSLRRSEVGGEELASYHDTTSRHAEQSPRYDHGQTFTSSYMPYKRSGSPLQSSMNREREDSADNEFHRRRSSYAHSARQPLSPSTRQRSPFDRNDIVLPGRPSGHRPSWQPDAMRETHPHHGPLPPPRSSYPPFVSSYDDRPTLPTPPVHGGSVSGVSRHEVYHSPPLPLYSATDNRRLHGGSTSSSGSSGDHASQPPPHAHLASYRPVAGMSRASVSSLRSLSMPYPYESNSGPGAAAREQSYVDAGYYDDMGPPRHHGDPHRSASTHSSPRHHPYAMHIGGGVGSSSVDALVGGSPSSMPRRRGKLPKPVTDLLKTWLLDHAAHPYPTEDEKRRLCAATNLSISQVSNWFINARRRILIPQGSGQFGVGPGASGVASSGSGANTTGGGAIGGAGGGSGASTMTTPRQSPGPVVQDSHSYQQQYQQLDELPPHGARQSYHHPSMADHTARHGHHSVPTLPPPPQRHHGMPFAPPPPPQSLPTHHYSAGNTQHSAHQGHPYPPLSGSSSNRAPSLHYRSHDNRYSRSAEHSPHMALVHDSPP